jgi:hypothetical protein
MGGNNKKGFVIRVWVKRRRFGGRGNGVTGFGGNRMTLFGSRLQLFATHATGQVLIEKL